MPRCTACKSEFLEDEGEYLGADKFECYECLKEVEVAEDSPCPECGEPMDAPDEESKASICGSCGYAEANTRDEN
ncbi:MAG: DNA-directed RNA polymerase subunit M/transcription elongation factor TFIIS [Candidatus Omnitrophota bacterium]|jgi:DNA-directed RNA polymerase subunit M/transcription elongation factor TFIIS